MPDFMRAADVLVTKAGPGTISEAFIAGLPMVLYARLPGQEDGNVDYVVDNGAGVWAPRPEAVVSVLRNWLRHPDQRQQAAEACLRLARPRAARDIAHALMQQIRVPV
jgi:1,2-diacylglycerol 3-beta-galactosyltransferase